MILYGCFGGLTVNILSLMELGNIPIENKPDFRSCFYWFTFIVWPIMGGFLVHLYLASGCTLSCILAFHIGLSAPLTLKAMASANPLGGGGFEETREGA